MCVVERRWIFVMKKGTATWVYARHTSEKTMVLVVHSTATHQPCQVVSDMGIGYVWHADLVAVPQT
jgi:hypothetical protein